MLCPVPLCARLGCRLGLVPGGACLGGEVQGDGEREEDVVDHVDLQRIDGGEGRMRVGGMGERGRRGRRMRVRGMGKEGWVLNETRSQSSEVHEQASSATTHAARGSVA